MELPHEPSRACTTPSDVSGVWTIRREIVCEWLVTQPVLAPAIGLMLGIALDAAWHWPVFVHLACFATAGLALFRVRAASITCHLAMLLAAVPVGALGHDAAYRHWPADHVVRCCGSEPATIRLTGTLVSMPLARPVVTGSIEWYRQPPRTRLEIDAEMIAGVDGDIPVSGLVAVTVREPVLNASAGDRVELYGQLYRPRGPSNPGELDNALFNRRRGVLAQMLCDHAANVRVVQTGSGGRALLTSLRRRFRAAMLDNTYAGPEPGAQLLSAMVLGERSAVSRRMNDAFVATGTVHYLSVSGAHVGMLASMVWAVGTLAGLTRRGSALCTMIVVTGYAVLAEPSAPVWRSAVTGNLLCISVLLRRPVRSLNWLALAALIILIVQPTQLFDPGFQLSFGTVVAILYVYPCLRRSAIGFRNRLLRRDDPLLMPAVQDMLNPPGRFRRAGRFLGRVTADAFLVSMAAWLGSALLTAYHFNRVALWGCLDTLVALPLIWATQMLGFIKSFVSAILPPIGEWLGMPLARACDALILAIERLARVPGSSLPAPAVPAWLVLGGAVVLLGFAAADRLQIRRAPMILFALLVAVAGASSLAPERADGTLRLRVLAVGNASAGIVTLPNGKAIVYDCGANPLYDAVQWTVGPVLAQDGLTGIDAAVISHPNLDHYSAIPDLAERFRLDSIMISPQFQAAERSSRSVARLLERIRELNVPILSLARGDRLDGVGRADIDVLWPPASGRVGSGDANDSSIVLRLSWNGRRILLCGDIGPGPQAELLATTDLRADVLVLPHHGKVEPTTPAFLAAVNPKICIRSSGKRDSAEPSGVRALMAGRLYLNTAEVGAVRLDATSDGLSVYTGADQKPVVGITHP